MSRIAGSSNHGGGGSTSATSQQQSQDIYWEFDPITGLDIRTMNDAKTAYAGISYPPNFFQYCSTPSTNRTSSTTASSSKPPPPPTDSQNTTTSHSTGSGRAGVDRTLTCRITIKALLPIVRHRNPKSLESLRIRSYHDDRDDDDESENHVSSNRGRVTTTDRYPSSQPLGLEFIWTLRSHGKSDHNSGHPPPHHPIDIHNGNMNINSHQRLVIHRIPIVDSTTTTVFGNVMNPMMYREEKGDEPPSELVVSPHVLLRLLEPLQRTVEVALIVRSHTNHSGHDDLDADEDRAVTAFGRTIPNPQNSLGSVSASSFHHSDTSYDPSQANNNNAILQATTASLLKTETACTSQEFVDFDFITTRSNNHQNDANHSRDDMPDTVNDEVILVFPIKEARAMLQFCCSAAQMSLNQPATHQVDHQFVHVSFHWGGQPFMIQTYNNNNNNNNHDVDHHATTMPSSSSSSYHMQLVLATMDHRLLTSMRTTSTGRP